MVHSFFKLNAPGLPKKFSKNFICKRGGIDSPQDQLGTIPAVDKNLLFGKVKKRAKVVKNKSISFFGDET